MPAFTPNPTRARTKIAVSVAGAAAPSARGGQGERTARRAEQGEQGEEHQGRRVGRDQVDPARLPRRPLVIFRRHQEERGEGHDLPGGQEEDTVAGHHDQRHAGREQAVEQPQLPAVIRVLRLRPVAEAVDAAQRRDQEDRDEEEGREPVHGHGECRAGNDGPGQVDRPTVPRRPEHRDSGQPQAGRRRRQQGCQPLPRRGVPAEEEPRNAAQGRQGDPEEHQQFTHDAPHQVRNDGQVTVRMMMSIRNRPAVRRPRGRDRQVLFRPAALIFPGIS